jgi:hypothetical protein
VSLRLTLQRSGGVAGISPAPLTIHAGSLPPDEAQRLRSLVDAADFFALAAELGPADAAPDSFGYTLTVDDVATGRSHSVAFDAASAPPGLKELVRAVRGAARRPPGA